MSATLSRADRYMGLRVHKYSIHVDDEKREKDKERKIKAENGTLSKSNKVSTIKNVAGRNDKKVSCL